MLFLFQKNLTLRPEFVIVNCLGISTSIVLKLFFFLLTELINRCSLQNLKINTVAHRI